MSLETVLGMLAASTLPSVCVAIVVWRAVRGMERSDTQATATDARARADGEFVMALAKAAAQRVYDGDGNGGTGTRQLGQKIDALDARIANVEQHVKAAPTAACVETMRTLIAEAAQNRPRRKAAVGQ